MTTLRFRLALTLSTILSAATFGCGTANSTDGGAIDLTMSKTTDFSTMPTLDFASPPDLASTDFASTDFAVVPDLAVPADLVGLLPVDLANPIAVMVTVDNFSFTNQTVVIPAGSTVTWTWNSGNHTVTSGANSVADGKFCSPKDNLQNCAAEPTSNAGDKYSHTFAVQGTFPYFCRIHSSMGMGMAGVVIVTP